MNSSNESSKTNAKKEKTSDTTPIWTKREIMSKIVLALLGIMITLFIQYQQWRLSKAAEENKVRIVEIVEDNNRKFRELNLQTSRGQLASTLIDNILSGDAKEQHVALTILKSTAPELYLRILEALAVAAEKEQIRNQATKELGNIGDGKTLEVLSEILKTDIPDKEKELAKNSMHKIILNSLRNARAFYEVEHFSGAAHEFNKVARYSMDLDIDQKKLTLADTQYILGHYRDAAKNYVAAFKNVNLRPE